MSAKPNPQLESCHILSCLRYRKLSEEVQNSLASANETAEEAISAMKTVRTFAAEQEEVSGILSDAIFSMWYMSRILSLS